MMKFASVTIHARDMEETLDFYTNVLEMKVLNRFEAPEGEFAFVSNGGAEIEIIRKNGYVIPPYYDNITLSVQVDDIEAAQDKINRLGIKIVRGPERPMPDACMFFIEDPNGVSIEFIQKGIGR